MAIFQDINTVSNQHSTGRKSRRIIRREWFVETSLIIDNKHKAYFIGEDNNRISL